MNIQDFNITILGNTPNTIIQIVIFINKSTTIDQGVKKNVKKVRVLKNSPVILID
jgi:hypothetical protein|tara:strand:- start:3562 stop:3726 length:165 start_codon:yes stop_codon:yes gene_type:complete